MELMYNHWRVGAKFAHVYIPANQEITYFNSIQIQLKVINDVWQQIFGKGKDTDHPRTGHEGPEGEQRYSSTHNHSQSQIGVGGQSHATTALPQERALIPIVNTSLKV
jgi:hypothetical protein